MTSIASNTIVRNGMPFIGLVLEQVIPFMDHCYVTVSKKCTDETPAVINELSTKYPGKIVVDWENVSNPGQLTQVRQNQLDSTQEEWVLFLDDDDFWPTSALKRMQMFLGNDVDGFAVNPFQLIDASTYDDSWRHKWFTKWFKKAPDVHYRKPWPRDLIYRGDEILYWRSNPRVPRLPIKFFHLSYLKEWSFRNEKWAKEFNQGVGRVAKLSDVDKKDAKRIISVLRKN